MAIAARQRIDPGGLEGLLKTRGQNVMLGTGPGKNHLILVAGAEEEGIVAVDQRHQQAESDFTEIVQLVADHHLAGR